MPKPDSDDDAAAAGGATTGKDRARPVAARPSDGEDEGISYRLPEAPGEGKVTVDQRDGSFAYKPKLGESD